MGKDEIGNYVISMTTMLPNPEINGVDMCQVICVDPKGWIPDKAKQIVAEKQAMNGFHMIEYLKYGTIPPQQ